MMIIKMVLPINKGKTKYMCYRQGRDVRSIDSYGVFFSTNKNVHFIKKNAL